VKEVDTRRAPCERDDDDGGEERGQRRHGLRSCMRVRAGSNARLLLALLCWPPSALFARCCCCCLPTIAAAALAASPIAPLTPTLSLVTLLCSGSISMRAA